MVLLERLNLSINQISSFQMKPISTSEAMSMSKIVAFGPQKIQTSLLRTKTPTTSDCVVNGERYRAMLNEFLFQKIEEDDMDIWFQQDGASFHTANVTIDLLCTVFENRIISRNSDVIFPPRSCDLTPLNYFLWGAVKDKCYANHPETIEALKYEIEVAIHGIEAQTIDNVLKNWKGSMFLIKPYF